MRTSRTLTETLSTKIAVPIPIVSPLTGASVDDVESAAIVVARLGVARGVTDVVTWVVETGWAVGVMAVGAGIGGKGDTGRPGESVSYLV